RRNRLDFSRKIIKEANLTPFYDQLTTRFPLARFVFIVREPVDNIRSLLNRWDLPGDKKHLSAKEMREIKKSWHILFNGEWLGLNGDGYIEMMAERWRYLADIYLKNSERMALIRYEDFRADKQNAIKALAKKLDLPAENDISGLLNVQFQPRGRRDTNLAEFFGAENLRTIERICGRHMEQLGYNVQHAPE
ncbi:MAG TPA: sulfotransferase, partial [Desulfonatronum sp.]|nr:sulfotransferase [Desulfonatronum sp.]